MEEWLVLRHGASQKHGLTAPRVVRSHLSHVISHAQRLVLAASCRQRNHTKTGPKPSHIIRNGRIGSRTCEAVSEPVDARQPAMSRAPRRDAHRRALMNPQAYETGSETRIRPRQRSRDSRAHPRAHPQRCDRRTYTDPQGFRKSCLLGVLRLALQTPRQRLRRSMSELMTQ